MEHDGFISPQSLRVEDTGRTRDALSENQTPDSKFLLEKRCVCA